MIFVLGQYLILKVIGITMIFAINEVKTHIPRVDFVILKTNHN